MVLVVVIFVKSVVMTMAKLIKNKTQHIPPQESYNRAKVLIKSHLNEHANLAQALMKYETLDAEEVKAIIDGWGGREWFGR